MPFMCEHLSCSFFCQEIQAFLAVRLLLPLEAITGVKAGNKMSNESDGENACKNSDRQLRGWEADGDIVKKIKQEGNGNRVQHQGSSAI